MNKFTNSVIGRLLFPLFYRKIVNAFRSIIVILWAVLLMFYLGSWNHEIGNERFSAIPLEDFSCMGKWEMMNF